MKDLTYNQQHMDKTIFNKRINNCWKCLTGRAVQTQK